MSTFIILRNGLSRAGWGEMFVGCNHGNRRMVQMDLTNQVPVLTASYLSLRISVNVQCRNEFHFSHFLNESKCKDWKN
jgi:hypothetical protein